MVNIMIYCDYLNMVAFLLNPIIYFWEIMWIEANKAWKRFAYCWLIKSNTQRTFSF